jgi:hypothetical protein
MHLFSEPTYTERLTDWSKDLAGRMTDGFGRMTSRAPDVDDAEFARGLGWASIGIGLTEVLAPKQVNDLLGLDDTPDRRGTLRVLGVREICHGISILTEEEANERMAAGVISRVAGDVLDSALLGIAATKTRKPFRFAVITAMVLGIGLADLLCAKRLAEDVM